MPNEEPAPTKAVKSIRLKDITRDNGINPRSGGKLNKNHVKDLKAAVEAGEELPPLVIYRSAAGTQWLSEGFHRAEAYEAAGVDRVPCEVRTGERPDALANACGSNRNHGLKRSNADKRRAVELLVSAFPAWSNPRVAEAAGVSVEFIRKIRPAEQGETREGADGIKQKSKKDKQSSQDAGQDATVATGIQQNDDSDSENTEKSDDSGVSSQTGTNDEPTQSEPENSPASNRITLTAEDEKKEVAKRTKPSLVDAVGTPVPRELVDTFGDPEIKDAIAELEQILGVVDSRYQLIIRSLSRKGYKFCDFGSITAKLAQVVHPKSGLIQQVIDHLKAGVPHVVCTCAGKNASHKDCRCSGYLPKWRWEELSGKEVVSND